MKIEILTKPFAFIATVIMFSFIPNTALAQTIKSKATAGGYFCNCGVHGYGCKGNHACINYCTTKCGFAFSRKSNCDPETTVNSIAVIDTEKQKRMYRLEWNLKGENEVTPSNSILEADIDDNPLIIKIVVSRGNKPYF